MTTTEPRFTPPAYVQQNRQLRALAAHRPRPCMLCGPGKKTTLYAAGWHCDPCARGRGLHVGPVPGAYPEHLRARRQQPAQEATA